MKRFDGDDPDLLEKLSRDLGAASRDLEVEKVVSDIIELVGQDGDSGLLDLTERFDGVRLEPDFLRVAETEIAKSRDVLREEERMAIQEIETMMPYDLVNQKPVAAAIKEFFGSSQLSLMDSSSVRMLNILL